MNMPHADSTDWIMRQTRIAATAAAPLGSNTRDLEQWGQDRSFIMSFARGLSVIHAFANQPGALSVPEICRRTRIPRAAVRRLLHTLQELGYLRQQKTAYELTPTVLSLGYSFLASNNLSIWAQPIVSRLSNELGIFCALSVRDGDDTMFVCVSSLYSHLNQRSVNQHIGGRTPLYCGASGMLFLGTLSTQQQEAYFRRAIIRPFTHQTPTELPLLRKLIQQAEQQRYAIMDRALSMEHRSIAVPINDASGQIMATLVAVSNTERYSISQLVSEVLPRLNASAKELSARMH